MSPTTIVALHAAYWVSFGLWSLLRRREQGLRGRSLAPPDAPFPGGAAPATSAVSAVTDAAAVKAPPRSTRADLWLRFQILGFFLLYLGLRNDLGKGALEASETSFLVPALRWPGAVLIVADLALVAWTMWAFRSWRIRAEIKTDHELATSGPFAWVRHPIYLSLDLLALATFLWSPSAPVLAGLVVVLVASDRRARAEEALLLAVFGARYEGYAARVRRFVPGLY